MSASSAAIAKKNRRNDPAPRHSDGMATSRKGNRFLMIVNPDPGVRYAWVWKSDEMTGVPYYESLGYEVVLSRENGPRPAAARKVRAGEAFEFRGMVLMQISNEEAERIEKEGPDGDTGQEWADMMERRLNRKGRVDNPFAGASNARASNGTRYVAEDTDTSDDPEELTHG